MFGFELTVSKAISRSSISRIQPLRFPPCYRESGTAESFPGLPPPARFATVAPMPRRLALMFALLAQPVMAEGPNLSTAPQGDTGSAAQLVLAQRAYDLALKEGEVLPLLAAIRLARGVTLRPATGWEKVSSVEIPPDAPQGTSAAADPGGEAALTIARNLAGEDPDLQDLVYDLDAQIPRVRPLTAVEARADLGPGQTDDWRLPLFGEVSTEIAVIGDGDTALSLTVLDEGGATVCAHPASTAPQLCRLTPARNGFFTVRIGNSGEMVNSYRLVGN